MKEYFKPKIKVFTNAIYIKKDWNPLNMKLGLYSSVSLFVYKMFYKKSIGLTLQVKGGFIDEMKYNKNVDVLSLYSID